MEILQLSKRTVQLSHELFDLFYHFFNSVHSFDYHLLHRFSCLISVFENDHEVAAGVLFRLLSREGRLQPRQVNCVMAKLKLPIPFIGRATIGYHTKTSKFILRRDRDFTPYMTQLLGSQFYFKNFEDIECPIELKTEMENILGKFFGRDYLGFLEKSVGLSDISDKIIRQVNYQTHAKELSASVERFKGSNIIIPRPANVFSKSILSIIGDQSNVKMIGHNLAYEPIYNGDIVKLKFPLFQNTEGHYYDDIRALKVRKLFFSGEKKSKILVAMYPYGDTGYAEGESNHFYQMKLLDSLRDIFLDYQDDTIFCLHPGTKDLAQVKKRLHGFQVGVGIFDEMLSKAKLVICTYRGTTCLGTALANNTATLLIKEHSDVSDVYFENLQVCNLGQITHEIKKYV